MKLLIIRHGDPDYSIDNLTEQGRREAQALADFLRREPVDRIFSSPLGRAKATAAYTADALKLPVTVEPWSAELGLRAKGLGLMAWDIHAHLLGEQRNEPAALRPHLEPQEYDAILADVARIRAESDRFLAGLGYERDGGAYRVAQENRERVAFFCHGGFGLTWLAHLLCVPLPAMWGGFFLPTSSITEVLFDERLPGLATPRCLGLGMLPHLPAAGLRPGRSGIKANFD